ncbi:MAG: DUF1566 domain-containing protein [Chitinispirillaceae bacterium]|nr:DUF1566 domain-containing protein [Chitinispirillaceae bacterium]
MKNLPVIIIATLASLCAVGCILLIIVILRTSDGNGRKPGLLHRFYKRPTAERTDEAIRIPDRLTDPENMNTADSTATDTIRNDEFPAPVFHKTYSCEQMIPAGSLADIISGNDLYCKKSPWSKNWANPKGRGIRLTKEGLSFEDSVVTDTLTGIMWQRFASPRPVTFGKLESVITAMNTGRWQGYANWRMPTIEELLTLLTPDRNRFGHYLPDRWNSNADDIWSCNPACDSLSIRWMWVVRMSHGRCNLGKPDIERSVLAVRDIR